MILWNFVEYFHTFLQRVVSKMREGIIFNILIIR